jgi:hypothetical protein
LNVKETLKVILAGAAAFTVFYVLAVLILAL